MKKSFRNQKYLERYEDVVFDLEQAINVAPDPGANQTRNNLKFVVDNSGEVTPFDWYNARIALEFKLRNFMEMILLLALMYMMIVLLLID